MTDDDSLLLTGWEEAALLRACGRPAPPLFPADLPHVWVWACLRGHLVTLREVRQSFQGLWDALPDDRYRRCGNGHRLAFFLAETEDLTTLRWAAWLRLPLPVWRVSR